MTLVLTHLPVDPVCVDIVDTSLSNVNQDAVSRADSLDILDMVDSPEAGEESTGRHGNSAKPLSFRVLRW